MKYRLFIFTLLPLLLIGCSQKEGIKNETIISDTDTNITNLTTIDQEKNLGGKRTSTIHIPGIYFPIIIGKHEIIFSGFFSLKIPQELENREYVDNQTPVSNGYTEYIGFSNNDTTKSFSIHINNLSGFTYSDKEICSIKYPDGYITKSEKTYTIQGIRIYAYFSTLMVSGPDFDPFKTINTEFCFVNNDRAYSFSVSNFSHEYMDTLINGLTFFN